MANSIPGIALLFEHLKSGDPEVRTGAWQSTGEYGAPAVGPLLELMADEDMEIARAAKRGLWRLVRHAGRPGAYDERHAVAGNLVPALSLVSDAGIKREVLWMLSEIGDAAAVDAIAALLKDSELRDDARMALERIPDREAQAALERALEKAPKGFQPAIAHSLRQKGMRIEGYPSINKTPVAQTEVKPIQG